MADNSLCALCQNSVSGFSITQGNDCFCCHGCQAVFNILSAAKALQNFETHPVFKQAVQFGLISNPALLDQLKEKQAEKGEINKWHLEIEDMWCPSCAELIRLLLLRVKGVLRCVVDYASDLAAIEFCRKKLPKRKLQS